MNPDPELDAALARAAYLAETYGGRGWDMTFLDGLRARFDRTGTLSPRQREALSKIHDMLEERAAGPEIERIDTSKPPRPGWLLERERFRWA